MAMKYIKPETKIIEVELLQMIAQSIPTGEETNQNLSKGTSFDFFEEEEMYEE